MTTAHMDGFSRCYLPILLLREDIPPVGAVGVKMLNAAWGESTKNFDKFGNNSKIAVV
jgi:hypothetical protein